MSELQQLKMFQQGQLSGTTLTQIKCHHLDYRHWPIGIAELGLVIQIGRSVYRYWKNNSIIQRAGDSVSGWRYSRPHSTSKKVKLSSVGKYWPSLIRPALNPMSVNQNPCWFHHVPLQPVYVRKSPGTPLVFPEEVLKYPKLVKRKRLCISHVVPICKNPLQA